MANGKLRAWRTAAATAAVLALLSCPARAATDAEQAEALIRQGVKLRAQDQTAQALPLFEKAYQVSRTPRTAAQLGLCELELGYYVEAERYLTEALASPDHPWVSHNKTVLKRQLDAASANVGELVLTVSPAAVEVLLNKKPVDAASLQGPIRLSKGPVDIDVRAAGYQPAHDSVTIAGGQRAQRTFSLVANPRPAVAAVPRATAVPTAETAVPAGDTGGGVPSAEARSSGARLAAWIAAGAAAGGLVLGTAEAFNAASKRDAFNNHTTTVGGVAYQDCGTANLSAACKPLKDAHDQALTLSIVGFAAAGALAITSSVLFVYSSSGHPGNAETAGGHAFACVPDLAARGFGCALRF